MKSTRHPLEQILALARRGWPPAPPTEGPPSAETIASLTQRSFAPATRAVPAFDPWWIWERAGRWSLASATAVLLLVLAFHPAPRTMANPFEPFTTDALEDAFEFAPRL